MSIATNIQRIINAKSAIRTSIINKGGSVSADAKIDTYSTAIDNLPSGWDTEFKNLIKGDDARLTIPSSVSFTIDNKPFTNKTNLISVDFSNSTVTRLDGAFTGCINLETCTLYSGFTTLGSDNCFARCSSLESITFPDTMTGNLRGYTFSGCTALSSVTIPNSFTGYIGNSCFNGCTSLKTFVIPSGTTKISTDAFRNSGITGLTIPATCYVEGAFYNCTALTGNLNFLASNQKNIPYNCCYNCSALTSIQIGTGVTGYSSYCLYNCASLTSLPMPSGLKEIGSQAFYHCASIDGNIIIPNTCTTIQNQAFEGCSTLKSITFPTGYTIIESGMCKDCASLTAATITSTATQIKASAFTNCISLTSFTIPDSVTRIDNYAFSGCTSLENVHFPTGSSTVLSSTTYSNYLFRNCGFKTLTIPDNITVMGQYCFMDNTKLTTLVVGNSCSGFGYNAFANCTALTSVTFNYRFSTNPDFNNLFANITSIQHISIKFTGATPSNIFSWFNNQANLNLLEIDAQKLGGDAQSYRWSTVKNCVCGPSVTAITNFTFYNGQLENISMNSGLTTIGDYSLYGTKITEINFPTGITSLGELFCSHCSLLSSVTLPTAATSLPDMCFYDCPSLTSITIPSNFTTLGNRIFGYSTGVSVPHLNVIMESTTPPSIGIYCFYNRNYGSLDNRVTVYVPASSLSAYQTATNWTYLAAANMIQPLP